MRDSIYPNARKALDDVLAIYDNNALKVAEVFGIDDAHVYIYRKHKRITPKLRKRLQEYDYIPPPKKRHRLCFEFDTGAELARVRAVVDSHEGGRTEWLLAAVDETEGE